MQSITIQIVPFAGPLGVTLYHEQLVYMSTDASGQMTYQVASANAAGYNNGNAPAGSAALSAVSQGASGSANGFGELQFLNRTYSQDQYQNLPQNQTPGTISIPVALGADLSAQWAAINQAGQQINSLNMPYSLLTANCFSAVSTELTAAGISTPIDAIESQVGGIYAFGITDVLPIPMLSGSASGNSTSVTTSSDASGNSLTTITEVAGANRDIAIIDPVAGTESLSEVTSSGAVQNQATINANIAGTITATLSGQGGELNVNGATISMAPNASATITGNSNTLTLGSNTNTTINGQLDVLNASIANLTIGAGSSAEVFGAYNTIVAGAGSSVTSTGDNNNFTGAPGQAATFTANGTNDNFNVDNSLINIPTQNCTDGIHCQGDTINASTGDTIEIDGDGENGVTDFVNMSSGTLDLSSNANACSRRSTIRSIAA